MVQQTEHADQSLMKNLIEECHMVAQEASSCATRCIEEFGNEMSDCIRHCLDAADLGEATALLAARGSPYVKDVAKVAGEVFAKCGKICRAHSAHDTMERCADACEQASQTCRQIGVTR